MTCELCNAEPRTYRKEWIPLLALMGRGKRQRGAADGLPMLLFFCGNLMDNDNLMDAQWRGARQ